MSIQTLDPPLASLLAQRVHDLTWDQVPHEVRAVAREHLLDALGLALASTRMDYGRAIHEAGVRLGGAAEAHVLGFGTPLSAANAALVNGTLIHGLDFDDTHIGAIYHATAPALAAALAAGEAEHVDGETLLLAYIAGLEVGCRLASAGAGLFHLRGFHPTGIIGTFAAACVVGKIRGFPPETLTSALGLCGSQAAGILELHESWLKRMHPGWAAHAGIVAATMAEAGFLGPATVFEGKGGLFRTHLDKEVTAQDLSLDDIGARWMTTEIALKPYPCCHFTHAFVDGARGVLAGLGAERLDPADVVRIECPTSPMLLPMVCEPVEVKTAPTTVYDALFSVQYVVALALTGRPVGVPTFYDQPFDDPEVLAMAAKVTCPPDPDSDFPAHFPGEVVVHLTDGRTRRRRVVSSRGTPGNPMSHDEIISKFHATAQRAVSADHAARIVDAVDGLEQLTDITALLEACS